MRRGLDFEKAEAALKRAAEKAIHGTREERAGRFETTQRGRRSIAGIERVRHADRPAYGPRDERAGRFLVSSVIASVDYDEDGRELDIVFTSGKTYRYFDVPLAIYAKFLDAASKGAFFNANIKDAFRFAEVSDHGR